MTITNVRQSRFGQSIVRFRISNQSGEIIPAYGACHVKDEPYRVNDTGEWIYDVYKPDADCENQQNSQSIIVNLGTAIGDKKRGWGTFTLPAHVSVGGDPLQGESVGPAEDSWMLWRGGLTHGVKWVGTVGGSTGKYAKIGPPAGFTARVKYVNSIPAIASGGAISEELADIYFRDENGYRVVSVGPSGSLKLMVQNDHPDEEVVQGAHGYASSTPQGGWINVTEFC